MVSPAKPAPVLEGPGKAEGSLGTTPAKFRLGESVPEINPADHKEHDQTLYAGTRSTSALLDNLT
jgi:hypothetical protein